MRREICYDGMNEKTAQELSQIVAWLNVFSKKMEVLEVFEKVLAVLIKKMTLDKEDAYIHLSKSVVPGSTADRSELFTLYFIPSGKEEFEGVSVGEIDFKRLRLVWCIPLGIEIRDKKTVISKVFEECGFNVPN